MNQHVSEDAALYALGALDETECRAIEKHAETCSACAELLAQACADVTEMCAAEPLVEAPASLTARLSNSLDRGAAVSLPRRRLTRSWTSSFAAAAALIILALAPSMYLFKQNQTMHQNMIAEAEAMGRVATSPHRTVAFASGMAGRVMYGPDGSWYVIVVRGAREPVHVVWKHDGKMTELGMAVPRGDVAMLYLPQSKRMDQLALMLDSHVVGQANLTFE